MKYAAFGSFLRSGALTVSTLLGVAAIGCATNVDPPGEGTTTTTTDTGGGGGAGGEGGGPWMGPCDQDCSKVTTLPCYKAVCNEGTYPGPVGFCVVIPDDGTPCDDEQFCTLDDTCQDGQCIGGPPNDCGMQATTCHAIVCDEANDTCVEGPDTEANGTPCQPSDLCQTLATCQDGECLGQPKDCFFSPLNECNTTACNPATGQCEPTPDLTKDGAACSLTGDPCMVNKVCSAGQCQGGTAKDCSAFTSGCNNGVCNAATGNCQAEPIPAGGMCLEATNQCNVGMCDAMGACQPVPVMDGTACNDYNSCTSADVCTAGTCGGTAVSGCNYYFEGSFEGGCPPGGWTLSGDWECGTPTSVGPATAYDGTACIATQIDSIYSNSQSYTTSYAQTPAITLPTGTSPVMQFAAWISTEGGTWDGMNVKISTNGGSTWSVLSSVTPAYNLTVNSESAWGGNNFTGGNWQTFTANLAAYAGQTVHLRFSFRTDSGGNNYPGVYIDNIVVAEPVAIPLQIATANLPSGLTDLPYTATLQRTGGSAAATWSIVSGMNHGWLTVNPTTGALSGTPTAANIGPFSVTVRVEEPSLPSNFAEKVINGQVIDALWGESFEGACPNGWTLSGDWECGVPSAGPSTAYAGTQCIATQIDADYNNNQAWATTTATSPAINLAGTVDPQLTFRMWVRTESGFDAANLKVSTDGVNYTLVTGVTPAYNQTVSSEQGWGGDMTTQGWQLVTANLTPWAGQTVTLRFSFRSDVSATYPGVYIDELIITD